MRTGRFSGIFLSQAKPDGEAPAGDRIAAAPSEPNTSVPWLSSSGAQTVLHYEIQSKLGEGGMGVVYKALDTKLNRAVALKFLPPQLDHSNADLQRFLQEAQALSALNHPHIATIYAVETAGEKRFLVLEYLPGGTLKAKLDQVRGSGGSLAIDDIFKYAQQTAEGLAHAHSRGIVHRDVKTSNLMLTAEGNVKITDFGLAKLGASSLATIPGSLMGTIAYMSPEQAMGMEVDARSDVFSFGVCLFELITGRLPFEAPNEAALITKVASGRAPELKDSRSDVPAGLDLVVQRAMRKRMEDRYQTMDDVLQDLRAPTPANLPRTQTRITSSVKALVRSTPKRKLLMMTLSALLFAAIIAGVLLFSSPGVFRRQQLPAYKLLAVLPFRNMTRDESLQALCDGLSEVIPNKLSQLEQFQDSLQVVAPSEIADHKVTSVQAARALGATLALEGSVQRIHDRLIVAINLRETAKQTIVAGRDVEVPSEKFPELQSVVEQIVQLLNLQLKPEARVALLAGLPKDPRAYELYLEGRGYLQRYDLVENPDKAIGAFQHAIARDPSYALAYAGMAEAYLRKFERTKEVELVDLARDSGQRAIQLNSGLASVHYAMGLIHRTSGEYERAIESFKNSIKIQPNSDAYRELAKAYDDLGRIGEAEATYQEAIQMHPTYWAGYRDLAVFYQKHGKFDEAKPYFQKVLELTPDNYVGLANLGGLYVQLGQPSKAIEYLRRSISIKPTFTAYYNLGSAAYKQKRYPDAVEFFGEATKITPTDARGWAALADAYRFVPQPPDRLREAYARAIELTEKELTVNPRDARAKARIASWRVLIDQPRALQEIREALQLSPRDGLVQSRAALVYEQSRMREEALAALKSAIEFGYSMEEIQGWPPLEQLMQDPRWTAFIETRPAEGLPVPKGRNQ
jgi:serine/threonine-protein kinase